MRRSSSNIEREPLPESYYPPPQRVRVTWAHNWTPLTTIFGDEINDPERFAFLREPYKVAATSDAAAAVVLADYPNAKTPDPIEGFFKEEDACTHRSRAAVRLPYRRACALSRHDSAASVRA
jgi:hypothetical protein